MWEKWKVGENLYITSEYYSIFLLCFEGQLNILRIIQINLYTYWLAVTTQSNSIHKKTEVQNATQRKGNKSNRR